MSHRVAAVVVTYNRKELLIENIESLLKQTASAEMDIVIIDNASTDGTKESIARYVEDGSIIYQNTGSNLGGAGGFHFGIKYAAEQHYGFVWVMDDDCIPAPDALEQFLCFDENDKKEYGFLSSKVLWKDNDICQMNIQRAKVTKPVKDFNKDIIPVAMASFVSLFIPMQVVYEVGLPIKEFFIWTDDWEYTRRISRRYPCYLVTSSVVTHKSISNIGANVATDSPDRLDRYTYLYRNDVYLYRREGFRGFVYETVRLTGHILRVLLKSENSKAKRLKLIAKGTIAGITFNPSVEFIKI